MRSVSASEVIGYFWIIVVIVFVGLIWWKVSSILYKDEVCVMQQGLVCQEKRLYSDGDGVKLDLAAKNSFGRWIQITGFLCSSEVPDPAIGRPARPFEEVKINAVPDSSFTVSGTCYRSAQDEGPRFKGIVYLRYTFKDEPYSPGEQVILGNIRGLVG